MRISDWSSDVCSSDLDPREEAVDVVDRHEVAGHRLQLLEPLDHPGAARSGLVGVLLRRVLSGGVGTPGQAELAAPCPPQLAGRLDDGAEAAEGAGDLRVEAGQEVAEEAMIDGGVGRQHVVGEGRHEDEVRSEEHTSELQSLMRISYAVFCLTKK